jgi:hypothetical protein
MLMKIPKSPEEVDALIDAYEAAGVALDAQRVELIALVDQCGTVPANATVSKRLSGLRKSVLVTRGSTTSVDEVGVAILKNFLEEKNLAELFPRLFEVQKPPVYVPPPPKHKRVGDVFAVLMGLPKRLRKSLEDKIAVLYAGALQVKMNAPAMKIEAVK